MPVSLSTIPEIGTFVDDYARAGVTTAEELALLTEDDIVLLGIAGLKSVRASKHLAAARAAISPEPTPAEEPTVPLTNTPATIQHADLRNHPAMSFLDDRAEARIIAFAKGCERIKDPTAWLDHVYKRALLTGNPGGYLARFARNLTLRSL